MIYKRSIVNLVLTFIAILCCFASIDQACAAPMDVVIVTDDGASDPLVSFLNSTFTNVNSITTGNYTGGPTFGATDLVIVSRNTNSGNYDDGATEIDSWNSLTQPVLLLNGYLPRNSRWDWIDSGGPTGVSSAGTESVVTTAGQASPLLNGVTITGGEADLFNVGGTENNIGAWADGGGVGDGVILIEDDAGTPHIGLATWDAGDDFPADTGSVSTFAGPRIFFGMNGGGNISDLTADGQQVLINSLKQFGLQLPNVPEPSTFALAAMALFGAALAIRRRKK